MIPKKNKTEALPAAGQDLPAVPRGWRRFLTVVPAVLVALVPKAACPACWPACAWLLGAVGISLIDVGSYLLPLTVLSLLIVVGSLGYRARRRRGYGPLALGVLAPALILISKVALPPADASLYVGIMLLIGASIWNSWPKGPERCSACTGTTQTSIEKEL